MAIIVAIINLCSINVFAFTSGYNGATELSGNINGYITSSTQNDWYKFTVTSDQVPTAYSVTLRIPAECVYNFDLRYREANSTSRPAVISNETIVTGSRSRVMRGVFTTPGTYFIRIYSQNGTTSNLESYRISKSFNKDATYTLSYATTLPSAETADWSICADIAGNYIFNNIITNSSTNRNYKNAYTFVVSDYTSDNQDDYTNNDKATPEETAIAADYIYAGDVLQKNKFEVENNKIYSIEELMQYVWEYSQPIIFYLDNEQYSSILPAFKKYVILEELNIGENTITYYYPSSGNRVTVDYDDFIRDGIMYTTIPLTYKGTNIVQRNYKTEVQAIYD